jgi:dipeptidyl aminopeptidase/acylaminoacyl peptidase
MRHARFLLRAGYSVLTPDARGHGASGGKYVTYGVLEADDVRRWADWLTARPGVERLYGLGVSMGAAVLLQSLRVERRFRAAVAESPFTTFEEIAYDRLGSRLYWPVVNAGFGYARLRFGVNLWRASPMSAVRETAVPVLLIHGERDSNIAIRHSRALHAANPRATRLWAVAGAEHVQALSVAGERYGREVTGWFGGH